MDSVAVLVIGAGGWLIYAAYKGVAPVSTALSILNGGSEISSPQIFSGATEPAGSPINSSNNQGPQSGAAARQAAKNST